MGSLNPSVATCLRLSAGRNIFSPNNIMLHVPHNKVPKPEFIHTSIPDDRQEAYTRPTYPSMESYTRRNTDYKPHNAVFEGSAFYGLKINGKHYEPRLCDAWTDYPNDPSCRDSEDKKTREVWDREGKQLLYKVGVDHGYQLAASAVAERHLFCGVHYPKHGCPFLEFPEFGRIHLGEFDIFRGRATLTMLRVEFGCPADGNATVCSSGANGHIGTS